MRRDTVTTDATSAGARAAALRARLGSFRATRRRGALGLPEVAALAFAALLLLAAVFAYLSLLVPARLRTQALETERADLTRLLQSQQTNIGEGQDTQQRVAEILSSLDRFEVDHLGLASSGTRTVIEEMNRLIIKNRLRISGGVQFIQLQETAPAADDDAQRARRAQANRQEGGQRVVQSVFPGIGVTLTVEGAYPNLRRFIRDIEADRQFVVVNTVELEGAADANASQAPAPAQTNPAPGAAQPEAPARGSVVSLRLEMAAYFRRAAAGSGPAQ